MSKTIEVTVEGNNGYILQPNSDGSINVVVTTGTTGDQVATGHVSVLSTATLIATQNLTRSSITIVTSGTDTVWIGIAGVTTGTGLQLVPIAGAAVTLDTSAAIYGIASTTTTVVSYAEIY